jgi:cytoskeletal protein RodZ
MESFGAYLRSLREEKGKSLEHIADNTKIALSNLEFLENDRFDLLPPRVFVKGFVRSYVQELGLNPEEVMARFEAFMREGELPDYAEDEHPVFHQRPVSSSFISNRWFTVALTVAGLVSLGILLLAGASRLLTWEKQAKVSQPMVRTAQPAGYRPSAAGTDQGQEERQPPFGQLPPASAGKKVLEIRALSNSWVRVVPDNGPGEELMMARGDVQRFTAQKGFSLQTGNAGGIRLRYDGQELPPLGKVNQTLSLTLP